MATIITSNDLIPINISFKVSAGPGAGKTHWLVNHIRNVISHSCEINVVKRIACITYTNVGTDTITERLGESNEVVDVCTIHSFLYANVVKPYVHLIAAELGLSNTELAVVDEANFKTGGIANIVLKRLKKTWADQKCFLQNLKNAHWIFDNHQFTYYKPLHPTPYNTHKGKRYFANNDYLEFKKHLWRSGYISFEDIMYLSSLLFARYPNIYKLIIAKYPYLFVDEFQDTLPCVIDFLKRLGENGTVIGVVGDRAQCIYEFLGATYTQFDLFHLQGMIEYEIHGNRRSSKQIIDFLNNIRTDFKQEHLSGITGPIPCIMVGNMLDCYQRCLQVNGTDNVRSLAYSNILVNSMRVQNGGREVENILEEDFDSNPVRSLVVKTLIKAVEFTKMGDLRSAWHQLDVLDRDRERSIVILRKLLDHYSQYKDGTLMELYNYLVGIGMELPSFRDGSIKTYYETHSYLDAAIGVKGADSDEQHKTIHKSKGDEFKNVFIILSDEKDLEFIINPNLSGNTTHRVFYVAASRAKERLVINVPTLNDDNRLALCNLPVEII